MSRGSLRDYLRRRSLSEADLAAELWELKTARARLAALVLQGISAAQDVRLDEMTLEELGEFGAAVEQLLYMLNPLTFDIKRAYQLAHPNGVADYPCYITHEGVTHLAHHGYRGLTVCGAGPIELWNGRDIRLLSVTGDSNIRPANAIFCAVCEAALPATVARRDAYLESALAYRAATKRKEG